MNEIQIFEKPEFGQIRGAIIDGNPWFVGKDVADKIIIQYGGSMKPENAKDLLSQEDIDGGLVGGASLKADSFFEIIKAGN